MPHRRATGPFVPFYPLHPYNNSMTPPSSFHVRVCTNALPDPNHASYTTSDGYTLRSMPADTVLDVVCAPHALCLLPFFALLLYCIVALLRCCVIARFASQCFALLCFALFCSVHSRDIILRILRILRSAGVSAGVCLRGTWDSALTARTAQDG